VCAGPTHCRYIDGQLDLLLEYRRPVVPNPHMLQLGRGRYGHAGFRGLLSLLRLYDAPLTSTFVHGLYERDRGLFDATTATHTHTHTHTHTRTEGSTRSPSTAASPTAPPRGSRRTSTVARLRGVVAATAVADTWATWRSWFEDAVGADDAARWHSHHDAATMTAEAVTMLEDCDSDPLTALCVPVCVCVVPVCLV